jgi:hypothetical protein
LVDYRGIKKLTPQQVEQETEQLLASGNLDSTAVAMLQALRHNLQQQYDQIQK